MFTKNHAIYFKRLTVLDYKMKRLFDRKAISTSETGYAQFQVDEEVANSRFSA